MRAHAYDNIPELILIYFWGCEESVNAGIGGIYAFADDYERCFWRAKILTLDGDLVIDEA